MISGNSRDAIMHIAARDDDFRQCGVRPPVFIRRRFTAVIIIVSAAATVMPHAWERMQTLAADRENGEKTRVKPGKSRSPIESHCDEPAARAVNLRTSPS